MNPEPSLTPTPRTRPRRRKAVTAPAPHQVGQASVGQRYLYAIQSVRAAEDQTLRTRRTMGGLRARVRRGLPANHWPLGYRPIPGPTGAAATAEPDPDLAPAVTLATDLFLKGESYSAIVRALDASPYRPPRVARWSYSTVRKMLANDFYAGFPHWNQVSPDYPSPHYPPLWDPDTHALILRERARRTRDRYNKSHGSPLAGVVFCRRCGHQMARHTCHGKDHWLRCSKHTHKATTGEPCHPNHVKESDVVAALAAFLETLATPAALEAALDHTDDVAHLRQQVAGLDGHLAELELRRQRLALALAAGHMDPHIYRAADDLLLADVDATRARLLDLHRLIAAAPDPAQRRASIEALAAAFPDLVGQAPPIQLRTLLQNAGLRVEVEQGEVKSIVLT